MPLAQPRTPDGLIQTSATRPLASTFLRGESTAMNKVPRYPWQIALVHEDDDLVVVVKPAGLPTANAPRGRPSLYQILSDRWGPSRFVGIVSRLDAPVSGLVVVAKTPVAAARLSEQFRERTIGKHYVAVVAGRFPAPLEQWVEWTDHMLRAVGNRNSTIEQSADATHLRAKIEGPPRAGQGSRVKLDVEGPQLGHRPQDAGNPREDQPSVQAAHTRARVLRRAGEVSLVELEPLTGRRHQLRVQLGSRGCPIVGDRQYGSRLPYPEPGGIALHACELELEHPTNSRRLRLTASLPAAWRSRFGQLFPGRPPESPPSGSTLKAL